MKLVALILLLAFSLDASYLQNRRTAFRRTAAAAAVTVIEFDGVDDQITYSGVDPGDNTFSIVGRIRPASLTEAWQPILVTSGDLGWYVRSSELIQFWTGGGSHSSVTELNVATWYHVAFVNNAGSWTLYINAVSDATGTGATTVGSLIRTGTSGSDNFTGRVAELAVFSVAITGTDVSNLFNETTTPTAIGNCLAHWKFDDVPDGASGDGDSFVDSSGNGNTGTGSDGANNTGLTGRTADF